MKTNREHYSYSQQSLFLASKLSFYKKYVLGEADKSNIRFDKGKEFANYKETGEIPHYCDDPLLETVGDLVPSLHHIEHKLLVDLFGEDSSPQRKEEDARPAWNKPILMYSDSCAEDFEEVYEYKTGKEAWTQEKVDQHEQLVFYAMLYFIKSGQRTIPKFTLWWIETEDVVMPNGETKVRYTGHVESFEREFTEDDILNIMMKTMRTMQEIHEWEYSELPLDDDFAARYSELLEKKDEIEKELNLMKLEVETQMNELNVNYAVSHYGKFSYTERKNYTYSKELTKELTESAAMLKAKQAEEVKSGRARASISRSLAFRRSK